MTWSFQSSSLVGYDDDPVMGLALPLGGNDYFSSKASSYAGSSQFVGFVSTKTIGNNHYLCCDKKTNPPIYLQQRPNQQQLIISVCSGLDTTANINIVEYCMVLHFERIS